MDDRLASANIAIIDDEAMNVRVLERFLRVAGFAVMRSWMDPVQAVADLESEPADIVLLDLMMPEMDGYAVLELLRQRDGEGLLTPVVVLTADVTQGAKQRALELGATDFLTKPFDQTEISLRVRNILTTRFLELDLEGQVRERTAQLREKMESLRIVSEERARLNNDLISAGEDERRRIADDIHSGPIGTMTALKIRLELARRKAESPLREEIDKAIEVVQVEIRGLRELIFQLRPEILDSEGLAAALRAEVEHIRENANDGDPEISFAGSVDEEPSPEARTSLFRIAVDALANARLHASARSIRVQIASVDGGTRLCVIDDGRGMDVDLGRRSRPGHLGLRSMRQRAEQLGGTLRIISSQGAGTTIEAWIPGSAAAAGRPDGPDSQASTRGAAGADEATRA